MRVTAAGKLTGADFARLTVTSSGGVPPVKSSETSGLPKLYAVPVPRGPVRRTFPTTSVVPIDAPAGPIVSRWRPVTRSPAARLRTSLTSASRVKVTPAGFWMVREPNMGGLVPSMICGTVPEKLTPALFQKLPLLRKTAPLKVNTELPVSSTPLFSTVAAARLRSAYT